MENNSIDSDELKKMKDPLIIKLKKEIRHLNIQILDKIDSIVSVNESETRLNKLQILKEIITSQRQEISWKNDDLNNFEGMFMK